MENLLGSLKTCCCLRFENCSEGPKCKTVHSLHKGESIWIGTMNGTVSVQIEHNWVSNPRHLVLA
jgi:hypothetical protein